MDDEVDLFPEGYWLQPEWSEEEEDKERIVTGWSVIAKGKMLFSHTEKQEVVKWLRAHGYRKAQAGTYRRVTQGKQVVSPMKSI